MANETLGASFNIDITKLKAGLAQANRLIRESESEFKAAAAGMDDWSNSQAGLEARIKNLNTVQDLQQKKVDALTQEYQRLVAEGMDETSAAAVKLRTDINKEQAALNKTKKELESQTVALAEMAGETSDNVSASQKLRSEIDRQEKTLSQLQGEYQNVAIEQGKNSKEAKELAKVINNLNSSLQENKRKLDESSSALEDTGEAATDSGDGFTLAKGSIATFIGNGLSALVGACKNAVSSLAGLSESTREYREDIGKLETAWQSAGKSTELATETYKNFYSVLGEEDRSVEAVNHLAKFVDTEKDMQKWTDICTGVWGTFGDSLPIEGLTEASNETAKVGKLTGVLADALNWAGVNEDDFQASLDKCNNEQERTQLITDTLNGLYSEAAGHYKENNKSIIEARKANSDYTDSVAELGEKIEPVTTSISKGFGKILDKVSELVGAGSFDELSKKIDGAFDSFINEVVPKVIDGLSWLKDHSGEISAGVAAIGTAMMTMKVANMIMGVVKAFQAFKLAQEGATVAQWLLNVAMNANPIGLIVAAIAGLVAGFVVLWKKCEWFRDFWKGLWEGIKNVVSAVVDWIKKAVNWIVEAFNSVVNWFKENWQSILLFLINPFAGIAKYLYEHCEWFRNLFDGVVQWFKDLWSTISGWVYNNVIAPVANFFTDLWNGIVNAYHAVIDPWIEIFKRLATVVKTNIVDPIVNFFKGLWESVSGFFVNLWNDIKAVWETVSGWFNDNVVQPISNFFSGLWDGISNAASAAWETIKSVWQAVSDWFDNNVIQPVSNFFSDMWNGLKDGAKKAWDGIKNVFSKVADFFGNVFGKAWQKVKDVFSTGGKIFDGIKEGIVSAFKIVVNAIIRGINKVVSLPFEGLNKVLDKLYDLDILGVKPFNWLTWRMPVPQIPELAKGGVVSRATHAIIGEDGKEAVVPLEKNTGWIKKLAAELATEQKQNVNVYQTNNYSQAHSRYELFKSEQATKAAVKAAIGAY